MYSSIGLRSGLREIGLIKPAISLRLTAACTSEALMLSSLASSAYGRTEDCSANLSKTSRLLSRLRKGRTRPTVA
jgi:hypothetical protein